MMPNAEFAAADSSPVKTTGEESGENEKLTDEQLRQLTEIVYKMVAEDLRIERERRGRR